MDINAYWSRFRSGVGNLLMSTVFVIIIPCLPVFIEWIAKGEPGHETMAITAAVLAAAFGVTAEDNSYRSIYVLLFILALVVYTLLLVGGKLSPMLDGHVWVLLIATCALHMTERTWWHLILNRPFP